MSPSCGTGLGRGITLRRSNRLILLIGIVLAIIAFVGIVLIFQGSSSGSADSVPSELPTVYATEDIPLGTEITSDQLETRRVAPDQVALDAFPDPGLVVGKIAATNIAAGQQLRQADFAFNAGRQAISGNVPLGLRAIAIPVDQITGVGTLINVGDHVDVIGTFDKRSFVAPVAENQPATVAPVVAPVVDGVDLTTVKVLVQDLLVVGTLLPPPPVAEDGTVQETEGPTFTNQEALVIVAVTPQQAEVIEFARTQGKLSLALRSPKDYVDETGEPIVPTTTQTSGIVLKNLLEEYGVLIPEIWNATVGTAP